jgi:hypothetical protein
MAYCLRCGKNRIESLNSFNFNSNGSKGIFQFVEPEGGEMKSYAKLRRRRKSQKYYYKNVRNYI